MRAPTPDRFRENVFFDLYYMSLSLHYSEAGRIVCTYYLLASGFKVKDVVHCLRRVVLSLRLATLHVSLAHALPSTTARLLCCAAAGQ